LDNGINSDRSNRMDSNLIDGDNESDRVQKAQKKNDESRIAIVK
jgi:hypothetical protein